MGFVNQNDKMEGFTYVVPEKIEFEIIECLL